MTTGHKDEEWFHMLAPTSKFTAAANNIPRSRVWRIGWASGSTIAAPGSGMTTESGRWAKRSSAP
ncbi:hypothetical protein GCM10027065_32780 [Rhodanobacter koreensis]